MKLFLIILLSILVTGALAVTIAALFPPKEYKGDGKLPKDATWDESIEDV